MKYPHCFAVVLLVALMVGPASAGTEPERYIIKFNAGGGAGVRAAIETAGGHLHRALPTRRLYAASLPAAAIHGLRQRPDVEILERDPRRYPLAEQMPYGIPMVQAAGPDGLGQNAAHTRKLCIMDTGYDLGHEDLPVVDVAGNDGYDAFDTGDWFTDGHGHGTHVAGTIAAMGGNDRGVVGVHAVGSLPLHIVKVFDNQGRWAYGSDLIAAIDQCSAAGAHVVNMSLGGSASSTVEGAAFADAYAGGMLFVAAAGNDGDATLSFPASYDAVVSVAGVDVDEAKYVSSQFNSQVELTAPAVGVTSTLPGDSYAAWNGTSMASPHVAGVAALVWGHFEQCSASQIRSALAAGARDLGSPGRDATFGYGLVQARASHDLLFADGCGVSAPVPPVAQTITNDVPETGLSGDQHGEYHFVIDLPAGASNLDIQIHGASGDADLYVRHGVRPSLDVWDCRPYINGNSETCLEPAPSAGQWHVMLHGYLDFADVTLVGRYVEDGGGLAQITAPHGELSIEGTVVGFYRDLEFNDGILQEIREVASGGRPSKRHSLAEHHWYFSNVPAGLGATLQVVTAVSANAEDDRFDFEISTDGGSSWSWITTVLPGGALKTYALPLAPDAFGDLVIRAKDTDRTSTHQSTDILYLDRLVIETAVDTNVVAPNAPALVALSLQASGVLVEWDDESDNEYGFRVERARQESSGWGETETVVTAPADATQALDVSAVPGSVYQYQVVAYAGSYSTASNAMEIITPDGIALSGDGYKRKGVIHADLTWSGGISADMVDVFRAQGSAAPVRVGTVSFDDLVYTDVTGLKGGRTLTYTVCPADLGPESPGCSNPLTLVF